MTKLRNASSWTVARLPARDLTDVAFEVATPRLERLGPAPAIDDASFGVTESTGKLPHEDHGAAHDTAPSPPARTSAP
jgi:hypothetical protein